MLALPAAHLWRVFSDTCGGNSTEVTLPQSVADDSPTLAFSHWQLESIAYGVYCLRLTSRYTNVPVEPGGVDRRHADATGQ